MRYCLLVSLIILAYDIQAQNIFPPTGNVGIGTVSPIGELDVRGNVYSRKFQIVTPSSGSWFNINSINGSNRLDFNRVNGGDFTLMSIWSNGNVGIGANDTKGDKFQVYSGGQYFRVGTWGIGVTDSGWRNTLTMSNNYSYHEIYNNNGLPLVFQNHNGGNVGIGTTTPDYKLDVLGTIRANEVKVATGWSDFVFEPDYDLPTLQEVEYYIDQNGHLPDIPSAEEVKADGINLGEMDAKLLQKIEELTLYVIELKKENEELKLNHQKQIDDLKSQLNLISNR